MCTRYVCTQFTRSVFGPLCGQVCAAYSHNSMQFHSNFDLSSSAYQIKIRLSALKFFCNFILCAYLYVNCRTLRRLSEKSLKNAIEAWNRLHMRIRATSLDVALTLSLQLKSNKKHMCLLICIVLPCVKCVRMCTSQLVRETWYNNIHPKQSVFM